MTKRDKEKVFLGVAGTCLAALLIWAGGRLLAVTVLERDNEELWDVVRSLLDLHLFP